MLGFDALSLVLLALGVALTALLYVLNTGPDVPPHKVASQCVTSPSRLQGETAVYRSRAATDGLVKHVYPDSKTQYEAFQRGLRNHSDRPCLGRRENDGDFVWQTYSEVARVIDQFGAGLQALGVAPGQQTYIGIFSINRPEWTITEQACNAYSMVSVALYDTLGHDAVKHIINQTETPVVVASLDKIDLLVSIARGCTKLKFVVSMDNNVPVDKTRKAQGEGVTLLAFQDVCAKGAAAGSKPHVPPSPDDVATICYTSGTTGMPKGAVLTHGNLIANNAAVVKSWPAEIMPTHEDVYLSYLPLAHMLERLIHTFVFANGARVGFFRGDVKKLLDDVALLRPTYFVSVPRLWNRIYDRVQAGVASSGLFKKTMFQLAYAAKLRMLRQGIVRNNTIWDKLVFDKIRARLGGRCKALVTGAAPIAPEVLDMLRICFGCQVYEGYGQTEACAAVSVTITGDYSTGHVGSPLPCVEIKLVDVLEMNYRADDKPNPRGEICVRGTSVFKGYFKDDEKTSEALDAQGWLHTGDVGELLPSGTLKVIDRKKNIFKLAQGEYIAAEKIENVIIKSSFVEQAWVYGDSLRSTLVAVVVLDPENVQPWAKDKGFPTDLASLASNGDAKKQIVLDIVAVCRAAGLHSFEIPREFVIETEAFSVENGILTPSFKIKRGEAKKKYERQIEEAYERIEKAGSRASD